MVWPVAEVCGVHVERRDAHQAVGKVSAAADAGSCSTSRAKRLAMGLTISRHEGLQRVKLLLRERRGGAS